MLLDTHALIWLDAGLDELGGRARSALDAALQRGELCVSAISFWETGMLAAKRRIDLAVDLSAWRSSLIDAGLREMAVTAPVAIRAALLESFHGDPADRLIVATAIEGDMTLVTADQPILSWSGVLRCLDASR